MTAFAYRPLRPSAVPIPLVVRNPNGRDFVCLLNVRAAAYVESAEAAEAALPGLTDLALYGWLRRQAQTWGAPSPAVVRATLEALDQEPARTDQARESARAGSVSIG